MNKKIFTKLFALVFLLLCLSAQGITQTAPQELTQLLNSMKTMQATFVQTTENRAGKQLGQKTSGSVMLERPGKFRWETTEPNNQLIIVNKGKAFLYDADLEQVTVRKNDPTQPSNPAMLLSSSPENLLNLFNIVKLNAKDKTSWFSLKPKKQKPQETGYQAVKIGFTAGKLNAMEIIDNLGQISKIKFNNVKFNLKIPAKAFIFDPPPGTDVFEN